MVRANTNETFRYSDNTHPPVENLEIYEDILGFRPRKTQEHPSSEWITRWNIE